MRFRFDALLRLRQNQERQVQRDMAIVNAHILKQEDRLHLIEDTETKSKKEITQRLSGGVSIDSINLYNEFFQGVRGQETFQRKLISEANQQLQIRRAILVEAMRKRRTLEILREREFEAFKKLEMKKETEHLDEVAGNLRRRSLQ